MKNKKGQPMQSSGARVLDGGNSEADGLRRGEHGAVRDRGKASILHEGPWGPGGSIFLSPMTWWEMCIASKCSWSGLRSSSIAQLLVL